MAEPCCPSSEEGASCTLPAHPTAPESTPRLSWQRLRGGVMFAVACLASPCCTPLYVPLLLTLLAGTPSAAWLTLHLGWVYGGLSALALLCGGLGWYWMLAPPRLPEQLPTAPTPTQESISLHPASE